MGFPIDFVWTFLALAPSTVGAWGIGKTIGARSNWTRVLLGFLSVAGLASALVFVNINWLRPLVIGLLLLGIIRFVSEAKRKLKLVELSSLVHWPIMPKSKFIYVITSFLVAAVLTYDLFPWFYTFENHDVLYFGWLPSIWENGGAIIPRVPTAWPNEMGANHTLPGVFIATIGIFSPHMTLVDASLIRSLVIFASLFALMFRALNSHKGRNLQVLIVVALAAVFFGENIGYDLVISSFLYVVIIFELVSIAKLGIETKTILSVLLSLLVIAKAPIAAIALSSLVTFVFLARKKIRWIVVVPFLLLILGTFFSWLTAPATTLSANVSYSVIGLNPTRWGSWVVDGLPSWLNSFSALPGWNLDWVTTVFLPRFFEGGRLSLAIAFYIFVSTYLSYAILRIIQHRNNPSSINGQFFIALDVYMCISLMSWLFVRNGQDTSMAHQAHAYLLASSVTFAMALYVLPPLIGKKIAIVLAIFAIALTARFGFSLAGDILENRKRNFPLTSIKLSELPVNSSAGLYYEPQPGDSLARSEVIASILGKRMRYIEGGDYTGSQIIGFLKK